MAVVRTRSPIVASMLLTLLAGVASATTVAYDAKTGKTVSTVSYTGAAELWYVPSGVTKVTFEAHGASAGRFIHENTPGARGGRVVGSMGVLPGEVFQFLVGGQSPDVDNCHLGCRSTAGGFNGGGAGGTVRDITPGSAGTGFGSTGGGGASDIRYCSPCVSYGLAERILVAGGGGGGSYTRLGGVGGGASGAKGSGEDRAGGGGTFESGGAAGAASAAVGGHTPTPGTAGDLGVGGTGGNGAAAGGGGGGGYYGGGGGGGAEVTTGGSGMGGGGSGYASAILSETLLEAGGATAAGNGKILVTYVRLDDQVAGLLASVTAIPPGKSLADKVRLLQARIVANDVAGACALLTDLEKQIRTLTPKKIDATTSASLIAQVGFVRTSLGCSWLAPVAMQADAPAGERAALTFALRVRALNSRETAIDYSLPSESFVNVGLYDIAGRRVATLASGRLPAGTHQATWNSSSHARGVYFVRITAGDQAITRTLLILP